MNYHTLGEGSKGFIVLLYQICETDIIVIKRISRFERIVFI